MELYEGSSMLPLNVLFFSIALKQKTFAPTKWKQGKKMKMLGCYILRWFNSYSGFWPNRVELCQVSALGIPACNNLWIWL